MDLVTGPLGSLASKLLQLLHDEYRLHKDAKEHVEWLSAELESIRAFLRQVGAVPWDQLDEGVKVWARQVREASYDMEDVVDTFLVCGGGGLPQTGDPDMFKRLTTKMDKLFHLTKVKARHDIAGAIEGMKRQVQEIAERRARYSDLVVNTPGEAAAGMDPRIPALYTKASQLVGIDEPREALVEMLFVREDGRFDNEMRIVSVVGLAGLGKTTLAKAVYDRLNPQFDCAAFVPVGRNPDPRKVIRDILIDLSNDKARRVQGPGMVPQVRENRYTAADLMELDDRQLINELRQLLHNERYFIVVDDIWETTLWDGIKIAFIDNKCGSRIMTTTRNSQVSKEIGEVYEIKQLSDDNSRKLFYSRISVEKEKGSRSGEMAGVSEKFIQKFDGVPLSIVTMASLLDTKPIEDWSKVYTSIGFEHKNNKVVDMMKILSFSYYDLPYCLRPCLLYLSIFPEDVSISKTDLILRWMAEGLIHKEKEKSLFEVGDIYFHELINRNMIIPAEEERSGILYGCRVHDMVLRLIHDISVEENFADVLDSEQRSHAQGNVRRLSLRILNRDTIKGGEKPEVCYKDMSRLRLFNAILCETRMIPQFSSFQVLRVLALEFCFGMEDVQLEHIGKLLHLRYLELSHVSHTRTGKLPKEIGCLKCLQTLILEDTGIQKLPASMSQLTQLLCLRTDENTRVPNCIGKLMSLVELEVYHRAKDKRSTRRFVKELGNLKDLKILNTRVYLKDQWQGRDLLQALSNLHNVHSITIQQPWGGDFIEMTDVVMGPKFTLSSGLRILNLSNLKFPRLPEWINAQNLPNICELTVGLTDPKEQELAILGKFQELRSLTLMILREHRLKLPVCGSGGFPNLRFLDFNVPIMFVQGAMPSLEHINFSVPVVNLISASISQDFGLRNLSSLLSVKVSIDCANACSTEVDEAEASLRNALDVLPNRPTPELRRIDEDKMGPVDANIRILLRKFYKWLEDQEC